MLGGHTIKHCSGLRIDHGLLLVCRLNVHELLDKITGTFTVAQSVVHKTQVAVPSDGPHIGNDNPEVDRNKEQVDELQRRPHGPVGLQHTPPVVLQLLLRHRKWVVVECQRTHGDIVHGDPHNTRHEQRVHHKTVQVVVDVDRAERPCGSLRC